MPLQQRHRHRRGGAAHLRLGGGVDSSQAAKTSKFPGVFQRWKVHPVAALVGGGDGDVAVVTVLAGSFLRVRGAMKLMNSWENVTPRRGNTKIKKYQHKLILVGICGFHLGTLGADRNALGPWTCCRCY